MSFDYQIQIRKNKSLAKCRICHKNIVVGSMCAFFSGDDGYYNQFKMTVHCDCMLSKIIHKVRAIQIDALKKEMDKFAKIELLLSPPKQKSKARKKDG